jgi:Tfp pilus assembly protein PilE
MLKNMRAFTLVEIIVVISLIGTMLFFAIPRMQGSVLSDESRDISRWIILNVADLKNRSVQNQERFVLSIDLDGNFFRIKSESITGESTEIDDGLDLPPGYRLTAVSFSKDRQISSGSAAIRFFPEGYSDRAIIHMTDRQNRNTSFLVEAFLPRVKIHDDHIAF